MQYRLVLHMAMVLSVEGAPTVTFWGFLPVLLCTLLEPPLKLVWPFAPISTSPKSAGAQPRATGLLKTAWEHPEGGSLLPKVLEICLSLSGLRLSYGL